MTVFSLETEFQWPQQGSTSSRYILQVEYNDDKQRFRGNGNVRATCRGPSRPPRSETTEEHKKKKTKIEDVPDNDDDDASKIIVVGTMKGTILQRPKSTFFQEANSFSPELAELAVLFCNSWGVAERVQHPKLSSEGEDAVRKGGLFHVEDVSVQPSHRKQDLGLRMLHEILVLLCEHWTLVVMLPAPYNDDETGGNNSQSSSERSAGASAAAAANRQEQADARRRLSTQQVQRHFFRMGFVQSGSNKPGLVKTCFLTKTMYFGSAKNAASRRTPDWDAALLSKWLTKEQSRQIQIHQDPVKRVPRGLDQELATLIQGAEGDRYKAGQHCLKEFGMGMLLPPANGDMRMPGRIPEELLKPAFALKRSERTRSMLELVRGGASIRNARALHLAAAIEHPLQDPTDKNTSLLQCLLLSLGGDTALVNSQDEAGCTPLHVAAFNMKSQNVEYLIHQAHADTSMTNLAGETPLQALLAKIQSMQDEKLMMGHRNKPIVPTLPYPILSKLTCLQLLLPPDVRAVLIEDWLSPRMQEALAITAELEADSDWSMDTPRGRLEFIPLATLRSCIRSEPFLTTWMSLWRIIARLLRAGMVPTVSRITEHARNSNNSNVHLDLDLFFDKGGRIEYVLDALFHVTENVVVITGDDGWEYDEFEEDIVEHPSCLALDTAFDVARIKCMHEEGGGTPLETVGPYQECMRIAYGFPEQHE